MLDACFYLFYQNYFRYEKHIIYQELVIDIFSFLPERFVCLVIGRPNSVFKTSKLESKSINIKAQKPATQINYSKV
jgi:hypothetical protein